MKTKDWKAIAEKQAEMIDLLGGWAEITNREDSQLRELLEHELSALESQEVEGVNQTKNDLLEELFWELRRIYQNGVAWSDNGIPFKNEIENFISKWEYAQQSSKVTDEDIEKLCRSAFFHEINGLAHNTIIFEEWAKVHLRDGVIKKSN